MKYVVTSAAILIVALLGSMVAHPVFALKNLFNCITKASDGGKLTFDDYVRCFNQQFHGQLNGPAHSGDSVKP